MLLLVLGGLAIMLSLVMLGFALSQGNKGAVKIALAYLGGGAFMLLCRYLLIFQKDTRRSRRRKKRNKQHRYLPKGERQRERRGDSGMALVIVLVVVAILAALLIQAQMMARRSVRIEDARVVRVQLRSAAADAAFNGMQVLADDANVKIDHPAEPWGELMEVSRPDGIDTVVRISDLHQYVDLNNLRIDSASPETLERTAGFAMNIMNLCGDFSPVDRIESLRDWLDEDDEGIRETDFYRKKDPPLAPANTWLHSFRELLHVEGFNRDLFERRQQYDLTRAFNANLIDCFCVIPGARKVPVPINLNTAPREVVAGVLGIENEELADQIIEIRKGRPLTSVFSISSLSRDPELFQSLKPFIGFVSRFFVVEASAWREQRTERIRALVQREGTGEIKILRWIM
ncbi:MAG: hypothetical protein AAF492_10240 [Verrucomicrobiota bacterium]